MLTALLFIIILSILVLIHEFGHFIVAKKRGIYVEEFGLGIPPKVFGFKIGETTYSINALPFGGFVKLLGEETHEKNKIAPELIPRAFYKKSAITRISVIVAGVLCNFILGWGIISFLLTRGLPVPVTNVVVEKVEKNSPAETSGLQKKDVIQTLTYHNKTEKINSNNALVAFTSKYAGQKIQIQIQRGNTIQNLQIIPRKNPPVSQGPLGLVLKPYEIKKYSFIEAPWYGLKYSVHITTSVFKELSNLVLNLITLQKPRVDITGPIGIAVLTGEAAKAGFDSLLQLIAILSLNLAVINILPFPALDGGRLAVILYEIIWRKKINANFEQKMNLIGFAVLMSLIILVSIQDIIKLIMGIKLF